MRDINGRRTTLSELEDSLRLKSESELLEEMEVILAWHSPDPELVFAYSRILDEKDPVDPPFNAARSLEQVSKHIHIADKAETPQVSPRPPKNYWRIVRAVPVMVAFLILAVAVQASGILKVFDNGDGTCSVLPESGTMELSSEVDTTFHSLNEAVAFYELEGPVAIQWVPAEYSLVSVKAYPVDDNTMISARYGGEGRDIINVRIIIGNFRMSNEVDEIDDPVNEYVVEGTSFYIARNFDQYTVQWDVGRVECHVSGNVSLEEIKMMINSIFRGSD